MCVLPVGLRGWSKQSTTSPRKLVGAMWGFLLRLMFLRVRWCCCFCCCCCCRRRRLYLISQRPELVRNESPEEAIHAPVVLTPNGREMALLAQAVTGNSEAAFEDVVDALQGPIILRKGPVDTVCGPSHKARACVCVCVCECVCVCVCVSVCVCV